MTEDRTPPAADSAALASTSAEETTRPPRAWGLLLAVLLGLTALAGAGGAALLAWQQRQAMDQLKDRLAQLEQTVQEQLPRRATLDALAELRKDMDTLRQTLEARQQSLTQEALSRFDALRTELATQQEALDTLRAIAGHDERLWRLGEIDRLLTAAQTRLRLLDDAATARLLLQEADRLAAPLGGEALPLREAVQRIALNIADTPLDREGIALRLTQLAEALPDLPRAQAQTKTYDTPSGDGWWSQTKAWIAGWLHIERKPALPTADRDPSLVEASTRLLQARRDLLARHTEQAAALVRQVTETVQTHLDTSDTRVRVVLDELRGMAAELARPAPSTADLTPAFTALRALRTATGE